MVSFYSDNTTGSAWVSSTRRFSLPHRTESLESPFLAGDYAKADRRRKKRDKRRAREMAKRAPRSFSEAPRKEARPLQSQPTRAMRSPSGQPAAQTGQRPPMPQGGPQAPLPQGGPQAPVTGMTVGRLHGVTIAPQTSFFDRMSRTVQNFSNSRLTSVTKKSFPASSGFALDKVELTKQEYEAWIAGDPTANANVVVDGAPGTRPEAY